MTEAVSMDPVFVFGSNKAGRHGKGAALYAKKAWGAEPGVGEGPTGRAYALPTKDEKLRSMSLEEVDEAIGRFVDHAKTNGDKIFMLTPVGCGLAGNDAREVAALIQSKQPPANVVLTLSWLDHLAPVGVAQ